MLPRNVWFLLIFQCKVWIFLSNSKTVLDVWRSKQQQPDQWGHVGRMQYWWRRDNVHWRGDFMLHHWASKRPEENYDDPNGLQTEASVQTEQIVSARSCRHLYLTFSAQHELLEGIRVSTWRRARVSLVKVLRLLRWRARRKMQSELPRRLQSRGQCWKHWLGWILGQLAWKEWQILNMYWYFFIFAYNDKNRIIIWLLLYIWKSLK